MSFLIDENYAAEVGKVFGDYIASYESRSGQVHAYLFRKGKRVEAHVSFPSGFTASRVTDPYVTDLWNYAREKGFAEQFQLIMS
jgi:hypothetical protein